MKPSAQCADIFGGVGVGNFRGWTSVPPVGVPDPFIADQVRPGRRVLTGPINFLWLNTLERWTKLLAPLGGTRAILVKVGLQSSFLQPLIYLPMFYISIADLHKNVRAVRSMTQKVTPKQLTKDHLRRCSTFKLARLKSEMVAKKFDLDVLKQPLIFNMRAVGAKI